MRRYAMFTILAVHVFVSISAGAAAARPGLPTLILEDEGGRALELVEIRIHTTIRGHLARTECELTYRNDLNRVVAGNFTYPLPADAELTGLALSFNGRLRHAVAVERERARVAYESTVHRNVDPALVEWSSGRSAQLRVYPIPAKGEKQVWLSYDQELLGEPYVLDLRYGKRLREVDIRIDAEGRFVRDGFAVSAAHPFRLQLFNEALDRRIVTEGEGRDEILAARDETSRRWYFAAASRSSETRRSVDPADHITVFWDASGSSLRQDASLLATFLDMFVARQAAGAKVTLIPFDIRVADHPIEITSSSTRTQTLADLRRIGATNYPALFATMRQVMTQAAPGTRILLVTDGVTSLGSRRDIARAADDLGALRHPLTIVNASPQADDHLLLRMATATNGWIVDLGRTTPEAAVDEVMRRPAPASFSSAAIPFVVSARTGSRVSGAAESDLKPAVPVLELRHPREASMVRAAFARAKLRQLLLSMAPDEQILEHGRQFQQLTPRTSLLVLESWRDYERWEIPMPADVIAEKAAEERALRRDEETARLNAGVTRLPVLQPPSPAAAVDTSGSWVIDGIASMGDGVLPGATITMVTQSETKTVNTDSSGKFSFRLDRPPDRFMLRAELAGAQSLTNVFDRRVASGSTVLMQLALGAVTEAITVTAEAPTVSVSASATASFISSTTSPGDADKLLSQLFADQQTMSSDTEAFAEFLVRRRETLDAIGAKMGQIRSVDERVRYYLTARSLLGGDKAFHFQAAMAFQSDAPALASRILSDLAEAYPDDSALLRILARIFDGWNETEIARQLLEHALEVAANESQTWRELVLLEARLGNRAGIDRISKMAATIDEMVREEILQELTPLIARWNALPDSVRNAPYDLRLERDAALQVDLMWDTNYTDVDLYVTEPGGETVMYSHRESAQHGRLHEDITSGYGPELYTIARPRPGEYQIALDYYATDETETGFETLAHLVVYDQSRSGVERQEFILLLSKGKEHRIVTTVLVR